MAGEMLTSNSEPDIQAHSLCITICVVQDFSDRTNALRWMAWPGSAEHWRGSNGLQISVRKLGATQPHGRSHSPLYVATHLTRSPIETSSFRRALVHSSNTQNDNKKKTMPWKRQPSGPQRDIRSNIISWTKVVANVFSNQKDVILFDFHHHGGIVTTEYYCGTLAWLEQTIRRERLGLSRRGVIILHHNERPHTVNRNFEWLWRYGWYIPASVQPWYCTQWYP